MTSSSAIFNFLWILTGGFVISLIYFVAALLFLCLIPMGVITAWQLLSLARFSLFPFGSPWNSLINQNLVRGQGDSDCAYTVRAILWCPFLILLCVVHITLGLLLFISIIFIPVARVHLTLLRFTFFPCNDAPSKRETLVFCCSV
eukprot:gb/GEZN01018734.1/.p1 GENE.gb/GEZN01018734.1/~~gb/GEZN01018734.1/.p1  ORF type:complete len:145 (+),score=7.94 gb/GEZN01018734.1/:119-553(+)